MSKHKLIVELPEAQYRNLCRIAEDCHLLPANAAELILRLFLFKYPILREEASRCD